MHETFKIIEPYLNENGIVMGGTRSPSWSRITLPVCLLRVGTYRRAIYLLKDTRLAMSPGLRYDLHDPESLPRLVQQLKVEQVCTDMFTRGL